MTIVPYIYTYIHIFHALLNHLCGVTQARPSKRCPCAGSIIFRWLLSLGHYKLHDSFLSIAHMLLELPLKYCILLLLDDVIAFWNYLWSIRCALEYLVEILFSCSCILLEFWLCPSLHLWATYIYYSAWFKTLLSLPAEHHCLYAWLWFTTSGDNEKWIIKMSHPPTSYWADNQDRKLLCNL